MGIHTTGVPRQVKDAIDGLSTDQLFDIALTLGIPTGDAPEEDHHDWVRQRIYDWLYPPPRP